MVWITKPPLGTQLDWANPLNSGLAAFWVFNENGGDKVNDLSGNANTGTLTNMAFPSTTTSGWNPGRLGPAIAFDSVNDYIDYGSNISLDVAGSDHTIETWIKWTESTGNVRTIVNHGAFTSKFILTTGAWSAGQDKVGYGWAESGVVTTWYYNAGSGLNDGQWHHVVATKLGSSVMIYVDGVSRSYSTSTAWANGNNRIGVGYYANFNGTIDEVRIYNRALTQTEIQKLYINSYEVFLEECHGIKCYLEIL